MLSGVLLSITLAGKDVGAALATLCSGDAGRRRSEFERENDACSGTGWIGCRGVRSSSLSSCMLWIALPLVGPWVTSNQLGERGGGRYMFSA